MIAKIIVWSAFSTVLHEYNDRGWLPEYTAADQLQLTDSTVAIFTHSSRFFDPLARTKPAIDRVVAHMKRRGLPTLYLHDNLNSQNPAWNYLYADGRPTAFLSSSAGEIDFDFRNVKHVVSLGGFFWCCQRKTLNDCVRLWQRDGADSHNLRITQVVDGVFDVTEGVQFSDPYYDRVRGYFFDELRTQHPVAAISLGQTLELIDDTNLEIEFVKRQFNATGFPANINVVLDYFGHNITLQTASASATKQALPRLAGGKKQDKPANDSPKRELKSKENADIQLTGFDLPTKDSARRAPVLTIAYRTSANFLQKNSIPAWLTAEQNSEAAPSKN